MLMATLEETSAFTTKRTDSSRPGLIMAAESRMMLAVISDSAAANSEMYTLRSRDAMRQSCTAV